MGADALPFTATVSGMEGRVYRETKYRGTVRLEQETLVLEYREEVTQMGGGSMDTRQVGVVEVAVPVDAIRSVACSRGFLRRPVLDIELTRLGPAEVVPWAAGTRVRLRLPRAERGGGRELCTDVRLQQADRRLRELGQGDLAG